MKAVDFAPWGGIDWFLEATSGSWQTNVARLRTVVPWFQRGINMTANAVSTIPFTVTNAKTGEEVDTSADWQNKRGGIPNPKRLIYLVAASLCSGAAYLRKTSTTSALVDIRYQLPQTITPIYNPDGSVKEFERQTTSGQITKIPVEEMVYFWLPDDTVETGPAKVNPVNNALLASELMAQMDGSLKEYGKNGFVPLHAIFVKGMPNKSDAENAENKWNLFLKMRLGVAKLFNAETATYQKMSAGMDEMRGSYIQIKRQNIEDIGAAFGIPAGVFMSNAANFATALSDRRMWYESGIFVLIYQTIQEVLTEQVYGKFGLTFTFNLNGLDAFQDDEVQKAQSFQTYVNAGMPKSLAAELVGLDMPTGWDYAMLDAPKQAAPAPQTPPQIDTTQADTIAAEVMTWQRYAEKHGTKGRSFEPHAIPLVMAMLINERLRSGYSPEIFTDAMKEIPMYMLAASLNEN
jgi:hypothetical protein